MSGGPMIWNNVQHGWICPRCNVVYAPFVTSCNCNYYTVTTGGVGWSQVLKYAICPGCGQWFTGEHSCITCASPESTTSDDPPDEK